MDSIASLQKREIPCATFVVVSPFSYFSHGHRLRMNEHRTNVLIQKSSHNEVRSHVIKGESFTPGVSSVIEGEESQKNVSRLSWKNHCL